MIIELKNWQKNMVEEVLAALPEEVETVLEKSVERLCYIEKQTGDGFFKDKIAYISRGIRHPRLMLERTCHEWGHGVEEWMHRNGFQIYPENSDRIADGFAISVLYPEFLAGREWKEIREIYRKAIYRNGLPDIRTESLIDRYVRIVRDADDANRKKVGKEVNSRLEEYFNSQSRGFLRNRFEG